MNLKKALDKHKRDVPHPIAYIGIVEGEGNITSMVIESDGAHPMNREDVIILMSQLMRHTWRVTNDLMENAGIEKVTLSGFANELFLNAYHNTEDGDIDYGNKRG